jgi:hypothetical protein
MKFSSEYKIYFLFHNETKKGNLYIKYSNYFNVAPIFSVIKDTLVPFYLKSEASKVVIYIYLSNLFRQFNNYISCNFSL